MRVSIHAPARGATAGVRVEVAGTSVSIHAPARGATIVRQSVQRAWRVSIHAPARGATRQRSFGLHFLRFQSTRPRGARQPRRLSAGGTQAVSIHAPARGATAAQCMARRLVAVSIHAPARGATVFDADTYPAAQFQSTRPRGARRRNHRRHRQAQRFNPRAREGRDAAAAAQIHHCNVSIHAPARGATTPERAAEFVEEFQSTRPRGARRRDEQQRRAVASFNPRAREGRDGGLS